MLVQLLERKAEREEMFQGIAGHGPHQAFATNRGNLRMIGVERRVRGIERRRDLSPDEGGGAAAQVTRCRH